MEPIIIFSIIFISSALILYSIGVWSEKFAGKLKLWHLLFFWAGFVADTVGTTLMSIRAEGFS